ncbi:concanavalin A-like lectin/glucanase [Lichtheimia hyalospora FSU 10163]|nr:concanavalin A-like lectin/glucanase [Lichtheimia hyalospora FSU 10163]
MMMKSLYLLCLTALAIAGQVDAQPTKFHRRAGDKVTCRNYKTDFSEGLDGWVGAYTPDNTWAQSDRGLELKLVRPNEYKNHANYKTLDGPDGPYNELVGDGPTFNSTTYMHYGNLTAEVQSAAVGGAVTAVILMGDGRDEIDFEWVGEQGNDVQTNYFWGKKVVTGKNDEAVPVHGAPTHQAIHTYKIEWTPKYIKWYVDGDLKRTRKKSDTCDDNGDNCKFPTQPSRIQLGLWDGSGKSGTAKWARGPIDWRKHSSIPAYIKSVTTECDPEYNNVINGDENV